MSQATSGTEKSPENLWKKPLILASTLFILGSFAYWLEYSHRPKREEKDEAAKRLLSLKDLPVAAVRISDGSYSLNFRCLDLETKLCKPGDNSKWEITEPQALKADDANVNSLLSSINNLVPSDTIDLKEETQQKRERLLKEYKLDEVSRKMGRRIEVFFASGEKAQLFLGDTHPMGDTQFAALGREPKAQGSGNYSIDENRVFSVPTYFENSVKQDLTHWRDKKVMTLNSYQVQSFKLEGKATVLGRRKDSSWLLQEPKAKNRSQVSEDLPGDIENIDNLLNAAAFMTAKAFPYNDKNDPRAKQFLASLRKVLTLRMETQGSALNPTAEVASAEPLVLTLLERKSGQQKSENSGSRLFAVVSDHSPVYEIDSTLKDRLDKSVRELRLTKLITSMERFAAKQLRFEGPTGTTPVEIHNTDGKWLFMPDKGEPEGEKVLSLLDQLSGNRITEFLDHGKIPAGQDQGTTFTLGDDTNASKRKLVFWKSGGKLYARDLTSAKQDVYGIDSTLSDKLPWGPDLRAFFAKSAASAKSEKAPASNPEKGHSH